MELETIAQGLRSAGYKEVEDICTHQINEKCFSVRRNERPCLAVWDGQCNSFQTAHSVDGGICVEDAEFNEWLVISSVVCPDAEACLQLLVG